LSLKKQPQGGLAAEIISTQIVRTSHEVETLILSCLVDSDSGVSETVLPTMRILVHSTVTSIEVLKMGTHSMINEMTGTQPISMRLNEDQEKWLFLASSSLVSTTNRIRYIKLKMRKIAIKAEQHAEAKNDQNLNTSSMCFPKFE
jgi:hypothetical protein